MLEAVFPASVDEIKVSGLTQWDRGQMLQIVCPDLPAEFQVHFTNRARKKAIPVHAVGENNTANVAIPNEILCEPHEMLVHLYFTEGDAGRIGETVKTVRMPITPRAQPEDYILDLTQEQQTEAEKIVQSMIGKYVDDAETAASRAETAAVRQPIVLMDNWWIWDAEQGIYVDSGEKAQGNQGVSGVYVGGGDMPEGFNVQIDPDGEAPLPYYTPVITQPDTHTMKINFVPSNEEMPGVAPVSVSLPDTAQIKVKDGLTVAIIGDSISTHPQKNACEMVIAAEDVGVELSAYITTYDVDKTISLDGVTSGYTITAEDVGTELTFVPCADDVGKQLGTPKNYNTIKNVWWQVAANKLGFEPIAAAWSGSSITSHTATESGKECSYAWHRHTIRKLGKRIPGSMKRIAPDVVLIYRGTNDLSHSDKVRLTAGYFDTVDWKYPTTDVLTSSTYGFKQGLALTIKRIRETYPRARIMLCTCNVFKRSHYSHFPTHNGIFNIPQMNNAIREVADYFGCHVIELDKCGITWENLYSEGYVTDNATKPVHPNASGHALMGQQAICDLVNKLHIEDIEPSFDEVEDVGADENTGDNTADGQIGDVFGTLVEGYYVNKTSGDLVVGNGYFSYTQIAVAENTTYRVPYGRNYALYDASGNRVKGGAGDADPNLTITTPAGAALMAVCYKYTNYPNPANVRITIIDE